MKLDRRANSAPLTIQEEILTGGTIDISGNPYTPRPLLNFNLASGKFGIFIKDMRKLRNKTSIYIIPHMGPELGVTLPLIMKLADLDPETGQTKEDPKIVGLWKRNEVQDPKNMGEHAISEIEEGVIVNKDQGPQLTKDLYKKLKEAGDELYLRDPEIKREIEGEGHLDTERL